MKRFPPGDEYWIKRSAEDSGKYLVVAPESGALARSPDASDGKCYCTMKSAQLSKSSRPPSLLRPCCWLAKAQKLWLPPSRAHVTVGCSYLDSCLLLQSQVCACRCVNTKPFIIPYNDSSDPFMLPPTGESLDRVSPRRSVA